jgi:hypothetical protein
MVANGLLRLKLSKQTLTNWTAFSCPSALSFITLGNAEDESTNKVHSTSA